MNINQKSFPSVELLDCTRIKKIIIVEVYIVEGFFYGEIERGHSLLQKGRPIELNIVHVGIFPNLKSR